jgi:hypothetical protein
MTRGSCLCGDVRWEVDGPLELMVHCHCSLCRKAHGAAFSTGVACAPEAFRLTAGRDRIAGHESSPGLVRRFCSRCGSCLPAEPLDGRVYVPAGCLDDDPGVRPLAHIFVGSKAPWLEIRDDLPRFDEFPEGFAAPALTPRPPLESADGIRGSCLCGRVAWVVEGEITRAYHCHCSRCRKAHAAAHSTTLLTSADGVRFLRGEALAVAYKVPEARFFTHVFCRACGGSLPRSDPERGLGLVRMGSLDDDPGVRPSAHIFAASKAPWYDIRDDLRQYDERPPG